MNEVDIVKRWVGHVSARMPDVRVFRRQVINVEIANSGGAHVRSEQKGMCDVYGTVRGGGLHFEIEAKNIRGTLRPEQKAWRDFCLAFGIPWMQLKVLRGETLEDTLERWTTELRAMIDAKRAA